MSQRSMFTHMSATKFQRAVFSTFLAFAILAPLSNLAFSQARLAELTAQQNLGPENPSKVINVTIWLKQRNKAELDELVRQMYEPGSPTFHHWLTRDEYRARYAPTAEAAAQVRAYLVSHNFTVTSADKFNHFLIGQGRVSDVQNAFNVQLSRVNMNGHIHRVSSGAASIAGPVGELVRGVTGLNDFGAKPALARRIDPGTGQLIGARPLTAVDMGAQVTNPCLLTGPVQETFAHKGVSATYSGNAYSIDNENCAGYVPSQLQAAYGFNSLYSNGWDGTGQTIIIVDAYGACTIMQDANTFSSAYGLPPLTSSNFQIYYSGEKSHNCVAWYNETALDVEWAHAVAPGADIALVLAPDAYTLDIAELWAIENPYSYGGPYSNYDLGYVISNSWMIPEIVDLTPPQDLTQLDTEYDNAELAAAFGISANYASGDYGDDVAFVYDDYGITASPSANSPASTPYATGVGGTSLFLDGNNDIQNEVGWGNNLARLTTPNPGKYAASNYPLDPPQQYDRWGPSYPGFFYGSGGGTSALWPAPSFQSSLGNAYRQVPDISFLGDPNTGANIIMTVDGSSTILEYGGTSLATPMFSALWAIANQAAGTSAPLGQAAAMLYSLPSGAITDIVPVGSSSNVSGTIADPPQPLLTETADDLAQPLENTTTFLSGFYQWQDEQGKFSPMYVITFGTDSSLVTAPGWDDVTGLGVPNGLQFIQDVVAAVP
jgi:subtilase family serine protease